VNRSQHIFVSPHFDDAVGSCGGTIHRLVTAGHGVRVLTVFGGAESPTLSQPAQVLHKEWRLQRPVSFRKAEDASACEVLGCEHAVLEIPDAIYRIDRAGQHLYPTFKSLRGSIAPGDRRLVRQLADDLIPMLSGKDTVVYCPMAIGEHVDHLIVRDCGRLLSATALTVIYYRDFFYDRNRRRPVYDAGLDRNDATLSAVELDMKVRAFLKYQSQIPSLFGTKAAARSYFKKIGRTESFFQAPQSAGAKGKRSLS